MKKTRTTLTLSLVTALASPVQADERTPIWLNGEERGTILQEMRGFLSASQAILQATMEGNMETVEKTARKVGLAQARAVPPTLSNKLPEGFRKLGPQVHLGFEAIADEATTMGDREVILKRLAQLQKNCIRCHAAYRITSRPKKP